MVIKTRTGWGYETLVREVSDSIHLRRFCRIALSARVPDESTVRKLTRRLGPEVIDEITRAVIEKATRERRFVGRAVRIDSTVVESDIRYPNDAALAADATRVLAREARKVKRLAGTAARGVRDRSRSAAKKLRAISRTVARRTGQAKTIVLRLTGEAGELVGRSVREARKLARQLRDRARGRGARAKQRAAERLDELADLAEKVARQITQRLAGQKITDRLVSMADPDARPIRKGKLRAPTEFGYVFQLAEITENTRRGARGLIAPRPHQGRLTQRTRPAARHRRRAAKSRPEPARRRARWRLCARRRRRAAARRDQGVHLRAPKHSLQTQRPAPGALPRRRRRPHQPPQTRLRNAPLPTQRPRRSPNHGRMVNPHLQPRHPRHPNHLTASNSPRTIHPGADLQDGRAPKARPFSSLTPGPVYPGQVARARARRRPGTRRARA